MQLNTIAPVLFLPSPFTDVDVDRTSRRHECSSLVRKFIAWPSLPRLWITVLPRLAPLPRRSATSRHAAMPIPMRAQPAQRGHRRMLTIGVLNTKGGVGKTSLATCLAVRASQDGATAVVDLDPQSSYSAWYKRRGSPDNPALLVGEDRASDAVEALQLTSPYDYIFVDGPTNALLVTEDAVKAADFVIVPMKPSGLDLAASPDFISLCQELGKPFLVVINDKSRGDDGLLRQTQGVLAGWRVPIAKTVISHRVSYVNAVSIGRTGPEKDKAAAQEIDSLWREIRAEIKAATRKSKVSA